MNILLDAYFDQNYGDDIFIETITGMFPNCKFYSFLEFFPDKVCAWAEQIPNLYLLPECRVFLNKNMFDAYICVGGDIFPDGGDYTKRKSYVTSVRQVGGTVAFLGFSLFHEYSAESEKDIRELMEGADIVAPRDEVSAEILKEMLPDKAVTTMADLAFLSQWECNRWECKEQPVASSMAGPIMGISVRRPNHASDSDMEAYCKSLAAVIEEYLRDNVEGKVKLFSLSKGLCSDEEVVNCIISKLPDAESVEHVVYSGDIRKMKQEMGTCQFMLCTRLHAMISCIAMKIPFIPIVYEVKMEHILDEIDYRGRRVSFGTIDAKMESLSEAVGQLLKSYPVLPWDEKRLENYLGKTLPVKAKLQELLAKRAYWNEEKQNIVKTDTTGAVCEEKKYARTQAGEVVRKSGELETMAEELRASQAKVEGCQEIIAQYLKTIEDCNRTNGEYFDLIESLNQKLSESQARIEGMDQEMSERITSMTQEIERLTAEVQERDAILNMVRPYFTSHKGSKMTRMTCKLMETKSPEAGENWEKIQQFFRS